MNLRKTLFALSWQRVLALGIAACGDDDDSSSSDSGGEHAAAPSDLSGSIAIDGSSTVQPFAEAAAELIAEGSPDLADHRRRRRHQRRLREVLRG